MSVNGFGDLVRLDLSSGLEGTPSVILVDVVVDNKPLLVLSYLFGILVKLYPS